MELTHHDLCAICQAGVSPDVSSVKCTFCGFRLHVKCDSSLTVQSVKMVNDEKHPAICYQCATCRKPKLAVGWENTNETTGDTGTIQMDSRLSKIEGQIQQLLELIQPLTNQPTREVAVARPPKLPKFNTQSDVCTPTPTNGVKADTLRKKRKMPSGVSVDLGLSSSSSTGSKSKVAPSNSYLSVICTNVPESADTLLASRHEHDTNHWFNLCSQMNLKAIKPVSLTRLSRKPDSLQQNKPRLLKVVVAEEKELEDIILSAYLLRDGQHGSSRVFVDVPWSERAKSPLKGGHCPVDIDDGRCLLILNVPEAASDIDRQSRTVHDHKQWNYLSNIIQADKVAVVDMFRIPKSPKYEGDGPRPLKLTLLTAGMAKAVYNNWCSFRKKLPREIRITRQASKRRSETLPESGVDQNGRCSIEKQSKNGILPALMESAL